MADKYQRTKKRYNQSKQGKISTKKYEQSEKGKLTRAKYNAKIRGLGWNPTYSNIISEPYVWHHINYDNTVTVPRDLHLLYTGKEFKLQEHIFMINQII